MHRSDKMYQTETGLTRVNFDVPTKVHLKLKTILASQGKTLRGLFNEFVLKTVNGKEFAFEVNGNLGDGKPLTEERIAEIFKAKLTEVLETLKEEDEDPELKTYKTKPMGEKPTEKSPEKPSEDSGKKDLKSPGEKTIEKPTEKPALVEKSVVAEKVVVAENGVVAVGKKVAVGEKVAVKKRTFFDWFMDGGEAEKEDKKKKPFYPHEF